MTDRLKLADLIDQCAAIQLVGSAGIKGYLPVGSPKIISAALRATAPPDAGCREALDYVEMADNRLECEDCRQCVSGARSYLVEAIALLKATLAIPQPGAEAMRCQRCGSVGDTFVLCAGCQSPITPVTAPSPALDPATVEACHLSLINIIEGYFDRVCKSGRWSGLTSQQCADDIRALATNAKTPGNAEAMLRKALETAAARFNMMGGVGLVNGADPKVGYRECMDALGPVPAYNKTGGA